MSYPWIGLPMEMFRANNQSSVPFILSHITRFIYALSCRVVLRRVVLFRVVLLGFVFCSALCPVVWLAETFYDTT